MTQEFNWLDLPAIIDALWYCRRNYLDVFIDEDGVEVGIAHTCNFGKKPTLLECIAAFRFDKPDFPGTELEDLRQRLEAAETENLFLLDKIERRDRTFDALKELVEETEKLGLYEP